MRLLHSELNIDIAFRENEVIVLTVENPQSFSRLLSDLWRQINGELGDFVLSEADKIYKLSKELEVIFNPFALSCNDKKIISRLYQQLNTFAEIDLYEKTSELNGTVINYMDMLTNIVPYPLQYHLDIDISALLKAYKVEVNVSANSLVEQVIEYIRIAHQICNINIFVFVNLKQYFSEEEILSLYEFLFYEKIYFLVIEGMFLKKYLYERCLILYRDLAST